MAINNTCLYSQNELVLYQEEDEEDTLIFEYTEAQTYRLRDYYCKHEDCNCSRIRFTVFLNEVEVGEIYYDYQQAELIEPSDYGFVLNEDKQIEEFNKYLSLRHESLKNKLIILTIEAENRKLEQEAQQLEREVQQLKLAVGAKIGRNEPCPCESGLKYKKCCLRK
ncbi:MAG: SEC-C metal-binding domain-containing protein [Saprospiraceae bacterium]